MSIKKIEKITIKRIVDNDDNHDYLGTFSNEQGKFCIKHSDSPRTYHYFNAANVENMKQARQNYERMMQFERGEVSSYGVKAFAEIRTSDNGGNSWLCNEISSGGLWGLEGDAGEELFKEEETNQLAELSDVLEAFGFTAEEIKAAPFINE